MNYLDAMNYGSKILKSNKIKNFILDSEILLAKVLNLSREEILINSERKINKKNFNCYKSKILRRKKNEPIAYIFNEKEFWKYKFIVNKNVLIPRPETEQIIEVTLKLIEASASKRILDVGTGSGCIILSIIKERPKCYATAIDLCKKAVNVAIINAKMHHLENKIKFININIDKFKSYKYDFIISNPPYINSLDLKRLDRDVRLFEPNLALNAGIDGLTEIRKLIFKSNILLKKNGKLIFEIGRNQVFKVIQILNNNGFYVNKVCKDMQLYPRVVISTKK